MFCGPERFAPLLVAALLLGTVPVTGALGQALDAARGFVITTGEPGGIYAPLGQALCRLYHRYLEVEAVDAEAPDCITTHSDGSIDNIERLRSGEADLAIVQADVALWALTGSEVFAAREPLGDLRLLFPAHDETLTVLVASGHVASRPQDILGERLAIGVPASGSRVTTDEILRALGWTPADFPAFSEITMEAQVDALCAGAVDVAIAIVGHPNGYVQRALYECGATLADFAGPEVEDAVADLPFLTIGEIPPETYRGQPTAIVTPALPAVVVARETVAAATIRTFVDAIAAQEALLRRMHPAFGHLDLQRALALTSQLQFYSGIGEP
jgi:TRAP transporter TAXI family solute receptor